MIERIRTQCGKTSSADTGLITRLPTKATIVTTTTATIVATTTATIVATATAIATLSKTKNRKLTKV